MSELKGDIYDRKWRLFLGGCDSDSVCVHESCRIESILNDFIVVEDDGHLYLYPIADIQSMDTICEEDEEIENGMV